MFSDFLTLFFTSRQIHNYSYTPQYCRLLWLIILHHEIRPYYAVDSSVLLPSSYGSRVQYDERRQQGNHRRYSHISDLVSQLCCSAVKVYYYCYYYYYLLLFLFLLGELNELSLSDGTSLFPLLSLCSKILINE